mmetsp:Transcript_61585/g.134862  ORF Transcript_61585/g.134862 Transcript_61585/m.134862 type:complete len:286 (-) Transcript_61585:65-922(-)
MTTEDLSRENLSGNQLLKANSGKEVRKRAKEDLASQAKNSSGSFFGEEDDGNGLVFPSFDVFPEELRIGPWSLAAKVFLTALVLLVIFSVPMLEMPKIQSTEHKPLYAAVSIYMLLVQAHTVHKYKGWPLVTYTCVSYFLLNLHFLFHALNLPSAAEVLRFSSLAMATVTTTVWWLVLVPILLAVCGPEKYRAFVRMNFSIFLLNEHLFNLPMAFLSHWLLPRKLVFLDFWVATVFATGYLFFYLFVLDANGAHFYIILSPRPWWCIFSYTGILLIYAGLFWAFS